MPEPFNRQRTAADCTVDGVTIDGHWFKNVEARHVKPQWVCERCETKRQTAAPPPARAEASTV